MTPAPITLTHAETTEVLSALIALAIRLKHDRQGCEAVGAVRIAQALLRQESEVLALAQALRAKTEENNEA